MFDPSIPDADDDVGRRLALLIGGYLPAQVVSTLARLGVADELGPYGRDAASLGQALGPWPRPAEPAAARGGHVRPRAAQTRTGRSRPPLCRTGCAPAVPGSLRDLAIGFVLPPTWNAMGRCPTWCSTGDPADTQLMWDYVQAHPDAAARFAGAMEVQTTALAGYLRTAGYAPPPCQRIVDVGGSRGILLSYLLQVAPMARGVLLDRAEALTLAPSVLAQAGVEDRAEIVTGDFMTEVPDGDLHVLCHVLHDWDDEIALRIVRNCFRASRPGGSLVVIEYLLPTPPEPSLSYLMDVLMMTVEAGGERTREDFQTLMTSAGYQFSREVPVTSPGRALPQRVLEFRRV